MSVTLVRQYPNPQQNQLFSTDLLLLYSPIPPESSELIVILLLIDPQSSLPQLAHVFNNPVTIFWGRANFNLNKINWNTLWMVWEWQWCKCTLNIQFEVKQCHWGRNDREVKEADACQLWESKLLQFEQMDLSGCVNFPQIYAPNPTVIPQLKSIIMIAWSSKHV